MFKSKKMYKEKEDNRLLSEIDKVQTKINNLHVIQEHAVDISDEMLLRVKTQKAKHRFLYKQARNRNVKAN
ncbi:YaaL family protein [Companilactobacillus sp. DQM5]|uniref:YaaL family protein n=1 Tax=Companilactobacillus sp. DQM5 TaxID=3463359 RepID=UPI0040599FE0